MTSAAQNIAGVFAISIVGVLAQRPAHNDLGESKNRIQWCAEFVTHIGQEQAFCLVGTPSLVPRKSELGHQGLHLKTSAMRHGYGPARTPRIQMELNGPNREDDRENRIEPQLLTQELRPDHTEVG